MKGILEDVSSVVTGASGGGIAAFITWREVGHVALGALIGVAVAIVVKNILWDMFLKDMVLRLFNKK